MTQPVPAAPERNRIGNLALGLTLASIGLGIVPAVAIIALPASIDTMF